MDIVNIISNVGFPIACVFGLGWYVKYVTDKHEQEIKDLRESQEKQNAENRQALENNTRAIQELVFYLKAGDTK